MWTYSGLVEEYKLALCKLEKIKSDIEEKIDLKFRYKGFHYRIGMYDIESNQFKLYSWDTECTDNPITMTAEQLDTLEVY